MSAVTLFTSDERCTLYVLYVRFTLCCTLPVTRYPLRYVTCPLPHIFTHSLPLSRWLWDPACQPLWRLQCLPWCLVAFKSTWDVESNLNSHSRECLWFHVIVICLTPLIRSIASFIQGFRYAVTHSFAAVTFLWFTFMFSRCQFWFSYLWTIFVCYLKKLRFMFF